MSKNSFILLLLFFASPLSGLFLSFRSKYDGYIYPSWKRKPTTIKMFYEDSVVTGEDFIVLGDGLGGTRGYSGIFSNHQCLKIANQIESVEFENQDQLFETVKNASLEGMRDLKITERLRDMAEVATTLVYAKLDGNILRTGVTGDSGYSLFRYDSQERIMKLIMRSKEKVHKFNTPYSVNPFSNLEADLNEHTVQEGDILLVASDGVLDVFPSSFLTAATNYLVGKMLEKQKMFEEKQKKNSKLEHHHLDFDYEYDMPDFLEAYIQNLNQITMKVQKDILIPGKKTIQKNMLSKIKDATKAFFGLLKSKKQIQQQDPENNNDLEANSEVYAPSSPLSNGSTNDKLSKIYKYEICNVFNPVSDLFDHNDIFEQVNFKKEFEILGMNNNPKNKRKKHEKSINCLTGAKVDKKTVHHKDVTKWECENINDLTHPIHPTASTIEEHHDFKECVKKAIPSLPEGTTTKMIANIFNSRYFARNIGLAAKFMSADNREKIDDFFLKKYYDEQTKTVIFPKDKIEYDEEDWQAKEDDIGIAAASVIESRIFETKIPESPPVFNESLKKHMRALEYSFSIMNDLLLRHRKNKLI